MTKTFFAIIPYSPSLISQGKAPSIPGFSTSPNKKADKIQEQARLFEESRTQLEQRTSIVQQGLTRCGLKSVTLDTDQIVELLYKTFNPGDIGKPAIQQ